MTRWRTEAAQIVALAGPLMLTQLAQVALGTTQVVMLGRLELADLAAGGLALALFNLLRTMGVGLVTPTGNLVAEATADARADHAVRTRALCRASFAIATGAGLLGWLLLAAGAPLLVHVGQDAEIVRRCGLFLAVAAPGLVPLLWFQALRNVTVGLRRPGPLLAITLASVALNLALSLALLDGRFGLPRLGLAGIALSGALVNLAACAAFLVVARRDAQIAPHLSLRFWAAPPADIVRLLRLGIPVAATYGSEAGFFAVLGLLAGSFGAAALAAHTVVNQAVYVVFMLAVGISHAVSISISPAWARRDLAAARRLGGTGLALGGLAMALVALAYLGLPRLVLAPFLRDGGTADALAVSLLGLAALLQFFDCAQNIAIGMLRGVGDTASAFRRTLIGYWAVGLPLAWLLGVRLEQGIPGLWLGLIAGLLATALQLLQRFLQVTRPAEGAIAAAPLTVKESPP